MEYIEPYRHNGGVEMHYQNSRVLSPHREYAPQYTSDYESRSGWVLPFLATIMIGLTLIVIAVIVAVRSDSSNIIIVPPGYNTPVTQQIPSYENGDEVLPGHLFNGLNDIPPIDDDVIQYDADGIPSNDPESKVFNFDHWHETDEYKSKTQDSFGPS